MPVSMSQAQVVTAATRQTMKLVTDEVDLNHDKKLDETELKALMADIDTFTNGGGPAAVGALPAEKTRMQMAVMQALTTLGDNPKYKDADTVPLSALRTQLKSSYKQLIETAKGVNGGGLMAGLGGLLGLAMLPDVAVKHVQEALKNANP